MRQVINFFRDCLYGNDDERNNAPEAGVFAMPAEDLTGESPSASDAASDNYSQSRSSPSPSAVSSSDLTEGSHADSGDYEQYISSETSTPPSSVASAGLPSNQLNFPENDGRSYS